MSKVNLDTIKPWITTRVNQLLGIDDDVVVEFVFNLLENTQFPDPKDMQMNLTGFLNGKNARIFMQELWGLLASAQENIGGIPSSWSRRKRRYDKRWFVFFFLCMCVEKFEGMIMCKYISVCIFGRVIFCVHCFYCCLVFQEPSEYWIHHSMVALPTDLCTLG
jgi:serine/arginine repetitive matrix protein 1